MDISELPPDLVAFLGTGSPPAFEAGYYETVTLFTTDQLRVTILEVTPNMSPFAYDHPHVDEYGHYAIPAVNLVRGEEDPDTDFPAWLFLWLPGERRYGSYDLDHGDLMVYAQEVSWSDIVADPLAFVKASDRVQEETPEIEFLKPWPRYPWVEVEYPD